MPVIGATQLQHRLRAIGDTTKLLRTVAIGGVAEAKALVPRRTGNLARTIRVGTVNATSAQVMAGGGLGVGYAAAVEFGSRAHEIVPRRAKVLAWGGARTLGGRLRKGAKPTFFAKRVHHPGTRPHPFLVPGLRKAASKFGVDGIIKAWNSAA